MSVLKGEGTVPILFGSMSFAVGSRLHRGYLARPDLTGEWPTVLVVAGAWGVTSSVKDVCRRLARRGLAAVAPDVHRGEAPPVGADHDQAVEAFAALPPERVRSDLGDIIEFTVNPAGFWSSAEHGYGVLGLGEGGGPAVDVAVARGAVAVALVACSLDGAPTERLAGYAGGVLGLHGRQDEVVPVDGVIEARHRIPQAELVIYDGVGHDFLDDLRTGYDHDAASDAIERLTSFFGKHLPPAPH